MPVQMTTIRVAAIAVAGLTVGVSGYFMQQSRAVDVSAASVVPLPVPIPVPAAVPSPDTIPAKVPILPEADPEVIESSYVNAGPAVPSAPVVDHAVALVTRAGPQPVLAVPVMPRPPAHDPRVLAASATEKTLPAPAPVAPELPLMAAGACEIGFTAMARPGAMVDLAVEAPCHAGEPVDVSHSGARFTLTLDAAGLGGAEVPALTEDASFSARFAGGETASADILMFTVNDYERIGLSWRGDEGFDLYALENGATYGSPGHVSATRPYGPDRAASGEGGFLSVLGDDAEGFHAQVYSWPARLGDTGQAPDVSVEATVTRENCGHEIEASYLRAAPDTPVENDALVMAVPGCDAVGEYLVLKNLPRDRKIAAN